MSSKQGRPMVTPAGRPAAFGTRTRERIDTTKIVNRLQKCANGELTNGDQMTMVELNAARILLNKTVPDLKPVDIDPDKLNDIKDITHVSNALLASVIEGKAERKK